MIGAVYPAQVYPAEGFPLLAAGTTYTEAGTISLTLALSGTDAVASVDSGTIPLTPTLSGADAVASVDSGTISVTPALSGVNSAQFVESGAIPIAIVLSSSEQFGPTVGPAFREIRDKTPQLLPIP